VEIVAWVADQDDALGVARQVGGLAPVVGAEQKKVGVVGPEEIGVLEWE
jgi:hypothetical protein